MIVVFPQRGSWRANRGFRHYVRAGGGPTICGRNADGWNVDLGGGKATCKTCLRFAAETATRSPAPSSGVIENHAARPDSA